MKKAFGSKLAMVITLAAALSFTAAAQNRTQTNMQNQNSGSRYDTTRTGTYDNQRSSGKSRTHKHHKMNRSSDSNRSSNYNNMSDTTGR